MLDMSPLTVEFTDCSHGWITLLLSEAQSHITVHATYLCDPFSDMLEWLENILSGQRQSTWHVDEESAMFDLVYTVDDGYGELTAVENYAQQRLDVTISPAVLVRTFYQSFRAFASSPVYRPDEWQQSSDLPPDPLVAYGSDLRVLRSHVIEESMSQE